MTLLALLRCAVLALSLGLSWNQFILIFARDAPIVGQLSFATTVASTIVISGAGLAYQQHGQGVGSAIFASALLVGTLLKVLRLARPSMTCMSAICFFAYLGTMS